MTKKIDLIDYIRFSDSLSNNTILPNKWDRAIKQIRNKTTALNNEDLAWWGQSILNTNNPQYESIVNFDLDSLNNLYQIIIVSDSRYFSLVKNGIVCRVLLSRFINFSLSSFFKLEFCISIIF